MKVMDLDPQRTMGAIAMLDQEFVRAFEACELSDQSFHHRDHIRLAWIYLQSLGEAEAGHRMSAAIRRFAARYGKGDKYHETVTLAWLRLVAGAIARIPQHTSLEQLTMAFPELLDKRTLERFYSRALLESDAARDRWVEPDLQPLP